jgi:beta-glucosidase
VRSIWLRFVSFVVSELGDLVTDWCTINEPNVYATFGYLFGMFPPGAKSLAAHPASAATMAHAHSRPTSSSTTCAAGNAQVTFAHHLRVFDPPTPATRCTEALARAQEFLFPGGGHRRLPGGPVPDCSLRRPEDVRGPLLRRARDQLLLAHVGERRSATTFGQLARQRPRLGDLPGGPGARGRWLHDRYPGPIWVTENGTADNTDSLPHPVPPRPPGDRGIAATGLPFERYYHWCFVDNWEWAEGEVPTLRHRRAGLRDPGAHRQTERTFLRRRHLGRRGDRRDRRAAPVVVIG